VGATRLAVGPLRESLLLRVLLMVEVPTVFVVEDDGQVCRMISDLVRSIGLHVESFAAARYLLDSFDEFQPGCIVADLRLPEMSGLELQQYLADRRCLLPFVFITGYGDIPSAVQALRAGAVDFLEKPFAPHRLLDAVHVALRLNTSLRLRRAERESAIEQLSRLSGREREVLALIVSGSPNKNIAARLEISIKTVETHRAEIMKKTRARHLAELIRLVLTAELESIGGPGFSSLSLGRPRGSG